ncbi:MAG: hypothetical protein LBJ88_00630 [Campylobacteraceae bacterium]|nr:hypothetical protein [Campylobacteraceae bacterium]
MEVSRVPNAKVRENIPELDVQNRPDLNDIIPQNEPKIQKELPSVPKTKQEFEKWAKENKVIYDTPKSEGVQVQKGKVYAAYDEAGLNDSEGVKLFKDITDTKEGKKIVDLQNIAEASQKGSSKLADEYIATHGKHPFNDKELKKTFRESGDIQKLYKLGSYVDDYVSSPKDVNTDIIKKQKLERENELDNILKDYIKARRVNDDVKLKNIENRLNKFERTKVNEKGEIVSDFEEIC